MKKIITSIITATLLTVSLAGCGSATNNSSAEKSITVGATSLPHAEILNEVIDDLELQGIELKVEEFSDYTLLNTALENGSIDANFFQHIQYLDEYNKNSGANLLSIGGVHLEPMGVYSDKISSLEEIKDGDTISIPNDATNEGRALLLLEEKGLITLDEEAGLLATPDDITENPKNLKFNELDAAQLPRTLSEVTISIINTNYALEAGLSPSEDAIELESTDSPYINILVSTQEKANLEELKVLYSALTTDEMKQFIETKYNGEIIPAF